MRSYFYHFHFGNAFRDGNTILVDLAHLPNLDFAQDFTTERLRAGLIPDDPTRFGRLRIRGEDATFEAYDIAESEFPTYDPRKTGTRNRYTWLVQGEHGVGRLARLDHESGDLSAPELNPAWIPGEATVVPRGPNEDQTWVLAQVRDLDSQRCGVTVLDGQNPSAAPVATAWFPNSIPPSLHGCFVPA